MKTKQILIGIYDEDPMRGDLLHNKLDQLQYDVFLCSSLTKLINYLAEHPTLLIFSTNDDVEKARPVIQKIRKKYLNLKILFRACGNSRNASLLLPDTSTFRTIGNCSFRDLWIELEKILPEHPLHQVTEKKLVDIFSNPLPINNPFYSIVSDPEKLLVLKLSSKGKSIKGIAAVTGIDQSRVETLRKQLIHESDSSNITEAVSKGKDNHVI